MLLSYLIGKIFQFRLRKGLYKVRFVKNRLQFKRKAIILLN
nr:MAG TPA: hypothetical protein [Bacteriophage sp.]